MTRGQSMPGPSGQCGTYTYLFLFSTGRATLNMKHVTSEFNYISRVRKYNHVFSHYLPEVSLPRAQPQQVPHGARVPAGGQHQAVKPQLRVRAVTVLHPHLGSR